MLCENLRNLRAKKVTRRFSQIDPALPKSFPCFFVASCRRVRIFSCHGLTEATKHEEGHSPGKILFCEGVSRRHPVVSRQWFFLRTLRL